MKMVRKIAESIWNAVKRAAGACVSTVRALPWRKMYVTLSVTAFAVVFLGGAYYLADDSYSRGYEQGERAGQCQIGCAMMDANYSFHDEDGACWCSDDAGMYYFVIPLSSDF